MAKKRNNKTVEEFRRARTAIFGRREEPVNFHPIPFLAESLMEKTRLTWEANKDPQQMIRSLLKSPLSISALLYPKTVAFESIIKEAILQNLHLLDSWQILPEQDKCIEILYGENCWNDSLFNKVTMADPPYTSSDKNSFYNGCCNVIREVVGNPYYPIVPSVHRADFEHASILDVEWIDEEIIHAIDKLQQKKHSVEEWAILSDMLEERGCNNEYILNHFRQLIRCNGCGGLGHKTILDPAYGFTQKPCDKCHMLVKGTSNVRIDSDVIILAKGSGWMRKPVPCDVSKLDCHVVHAIRNTWEMKVEGR